MSRKRKILIELIEIERERNKETDRKRYRGER